MARCDAWVAVPGRAVSVHKCHHQAKEGSIFCGVHSRTKETKAEPRDQTALPAVTSSTTTTYRVALEWAGEAGPIVAPPYRKEGTLALVTIASLSVMNDQDIAQRGSLNLRGFILKKDGTPGQVDWELRHASLDLLPEDARAYLVTSLERERGTR